ncbi:PGRS-family protein, partial [Cellulomonas terrae]|uniref:PGRS-family protein n=1 Tax=Cellulomonas terrae TaxID=311234 RepID=UPI0016497AA0
PEGSPETAASSGESAPESTPTTEESSTAEATPTVVAPVDAGAAAEALRAANPNIAAVTVYDETNDPNNLIGRPGQYTSAAQITDGRAAGGEGIDAGAVVEVFATPQEAQARSTYIQETLAELGPAFGTEWHHLQGTHLLRVSGTLVPSANEEYAVAWNALLPAP